MVFKDILAEGKAFRRQVFTLYEEAFPEEEKKPWERMELLAVEGKMELLAVTEGECFVGLAFNMLDGEIALLDYFAIAPDLRGGGFGGRAIGCLLERFAGKKYIFEIEKQDPRAENAEERKRRKKFYLRNGLQETGLFVNAYQTDFELLTPDGSLTFEEYVTVLRDILGEEWMNTLNPRVIPAEKEKKDETTGSN